MSKQKITLCEQKGTNVSIYVEATLHKGELTISGQDIGQAADDFWGDRDYEYWLTLPPAVTKEFFKLICANKKKNPLNELKKKLHGTEAFSDIRSFCASHGIEARFDSYS